MDDEGERIILPEWIQLGHIGEVEGRRFETDDIRHKFQQSHHGIDIPMDMPGAAMVASLRRRIGLVLKTDARIDLQAAKVGKTPFLARGVCQPDRLPETDGKTDPGDWVRTGADGRAGISKVRKIARPDLDTPQRQGQHAVPADVANRIDEVASTSRITCGGIFCFGGRREQADDYDKADDDDPFHTRQRHPRHPMGDLRAGQNATIAESDLIEPHGVLADIGSTGISSISNVRPCCIMRDGVFERLNWVARAER